MKKRILSLLLTTVMILSTLVIIPVTAETNNTFNANDATPTITTLADLEAFDAAIEGGNFFSGKTVKLAGNITLPSTFTGIGADKSGAKGFGGIFDGQGHTITMSGHGKTGSWTGALFTFTENGGSSATIKNLNVDGTMKITNYGKDNGSAVLLGRPLTSEVIIENVRISVDVELATNFDTFGAFIYDLRGATSYNNVSIKGCVFDGTITCKNQANFIAGFIGNVQENAKKSVTVQDCIYAGTMKFYDPSVAGYSAAFVADVKQNDDTYVTIKDCYSIGTMTYHSTGTFDTNGVIVGKIGANHNVTAENVYYVDIKKFGKDEMMGIKGAGDYTVSATNVSAMSKEAIAALTASAFSNTSTMTFKEADNDYFYYPAPKELVKGGWISSLMLVNMGDNTFNAEDETPTITTLADLEAFDAAIEGGNFFSGKTVKLAGDITLPSTFTGIGANKDGAKGFGGIFDGQGHTITMSGHGKTGSWTGALFTFTENGGASATIKNLKVDGKMKITSNGTDEANAVLLGRPLTKELIIENVHISVDVELATNTNVFGAFVYDLRGATQYDNVLIKGCVYDGTITCKNQAQKISGFIGSVSATWSGSPTKAVAIQDCVYAGTITFADTSVSKTSGGFVGSVGNDSGNTVAVKDCYSIGTMSFGSAFAEAGEQVNGVIFGEASGNATVRAENVYYVDIAKSNKSGVMAIAGSGTVDSNTNVAAKSKQEIAALTDTAFSNTSTMEIGNTNGLNLYYPCPEGLVPEEGWIPSLCYVTGDAAVLGAQIRCTEAGDQYSGIRFVSVFKKDKVEGAQTADANFGIILIAKNNLNNIEGAVTVDSLVAAGGINIQATSADESVDGYYRVNAVVYEIAADNYKDEIVAYTYVDGVLVGESVTRSIYQVAELCLKDANATEAQKNFCKTIVPTND